MRDSVGLGLLVSFLLSIPIGIFELLIASGAPGNWVLWLFFPYLAYSAISALVCTGHPRMGGWSDHRWHDYLNPDTGRNPVPCQCNFLGGLRMSVDLLSFAVSARLGNHLLPYMTRRLSLERL
jgi:hypothetical protein